MVGAFSSALKEAGTSFARAISNESDYRDLIENIFLSPDADCIETLEEKRNTVNYEVSSTQSRPPFHYVSVGRLGSSDD